LCEFVFWVYLDTFQLSYYFPKLTLVTIFLIRYLHCNQYSIMASTKRKLLKEMHQIGKKMKAAYKEHHCIQHASEVKDAHNSLQYMNYLQEQMSNDLLVIDKSSDEETKEKSTEPNKKRNTTETNKLLPEIIEFQKQRSKIKIGDERNKFDKDFVTKILEQKVETEEKQEDNKRYVFRVKIGHIYHEVLLNDVQRLNSEKWINDNIVDAFGFLLNEVANNILILNSALYTELMGGNGRTYDFQKTNTWTKRKAANHMKMIFEFNVVIAPCCMNKDHWVTMVINFIEKSLNVYDSKRNEMADLALIANIKHFLLDEWKNKCQANRDLYDLNLDQWTVNLNKDFQQQKGGNNCGVFMMQCMLLVCAKKTVHKAFCNEDIDDIRQQIALQLCSRQIGPT